MYKTPKIKPKHQTIVTGAFMPGLDPNFMSGMVIQSRESRAKEPFIMNGPAWKRNDINK